jgi:hypothetical protein
VTQAAALLACVVLAGLGQFQASLVAGAPLGRFAWGGAHEVLPRRLRVGSLTSVGLYALFAVIVLEKAGVTSIVAAAAVSDIGSWVLSGYFFLGVLVNAISRSKPERAVMTPVALMLSVLCLLVAWGG